MATEVSKSSNAKDVLTNILKKTMSIQEKNPEIARKLQNFQMSTGSPKQAPGGMGNIEGGIKFDYNKAIGPKGTSATIVEETSTEEAIYPATSKKVAKVKRKLTVEQATVRELRGILEGMGEELVEDAGGKFDLIEYTTVSDQIHTLVFQHHRGKAAMQIECKIDLFEGVSTCAITTKTSEPYTQTISRKYEAADLLVKDLINLIDAADRV